MGEPGGRALEAVSKEREKEKVCNFSSPYLQNPWTAHGGVPPCTDLLWPQRRCSSLHPSPDMLLPHSVDAGSRFCWVNATRVLEVLWPPPTPHCQAGEEMLVYFPKRCTNWIFFFNAFTFTPILHNQARLWGSQKYPELNVFWLLSFRLEEAQVGPTLFR